MTSLTIVYASGATLSLCGTYDEMTDRFNRSTVNPDIVFMLLIDQSGELVGNQYCRADCRRYGAR